MKDSKRGRSSVFRRDGMDTFKMSIRAAYPDFKSDRSVVDKYYATTVYSFLKESASDYSRH